MVFSHSLDSMISEVFSHLSDSVILRFYRQQQIHSLVPDQDRSNSPTLGVWSVWSTVHAKFVMLKVVTGDLGIDAEPGKDGCCCSGCCPAAGGE